MKSSHYGNTVMHPGDDDQRYRISVFLMAYQRPKYWEFHCSYCGRKLLELSGEVAYMSDMDDATRYDQKLVPPIIIKCGGPYCKRWYEFSNLS